MNSIKKELKKEAEIQKLKKKNQQKSRLSMFLFTSNNDLTNLVAQQCAMQWKVSISIQTTGLLALDPRSFQSAFTCSKLTIQTLE